jgi:antitoxin component of RelBE/YafQ-DinJ toxin-antitoxin module
MSGDRKRSKKFFNLQCQIDPTVIRQARIIMAAKNLTLSEAVEESLVQWIAVNKAIVLEEFEE